MGFRQQYISFAHKTIRRISIGNAVSKYRCHRQYHPFVTRRKISILQMSIFASQSISATRTIDASIRYALRRMRVNERNAPFPEQYRSRGPIVVRQPPESVTYCLQGHPWSRGPGVVRRLPGFVTHCQRALPAARSWPSMMSVMMSILGRWKGPLKVEPLVEGIVGRPSRRR